jgi:hypothetical protein
VRGDLHPLLFFGGTYGWFLMSFQYFGYVMGYGTPGRRLSPRFASRFGWPPVTVASLVVLSIGAGLMCSTETTARSG